MRKLLNPKICFTIIFAFIITAIPLRAFSIGGDNRYVITAVAAPSNDGTITPCGRILVNEREDITFTIAPKPGYYANVVVDGVSLGNLSQYTFTKVSQNHSIVARFAPITKTFLIYASNSTKTFRGDAGGDIEPYGANIVRQGEDKKFTITAHPHWKIKDVKVDKASIGSVSSHTFYKVNADHEIDVEFERVDFIIDYCAPGGAGKIKITPNGDHTGEVWVTPHGNQKFTITPNPGYEIKDVQIDVFTKLGPVNSYEFKDVTKDHSLLVSFEETTKFQIVAGVSSCGSINPSGFVYVEKGKSQDFNWAPDPGYKIRYITVDDKDLQPPFPNPYTFNNVDSNHTIFVRFEIDTSINYNITASVNSSLFGNISPSGNVTVRGGEDQTFNITANPGYKIEAVEVDGTSVGAVPVYTFNEVHANHTIQAHFKRDIPTYIIEAFSSVGGTISPMGQVQVQEGDNKTFAITATEELGYEIMDVVVDGNSEGAIPQYTFWNVREGHTIVAYFKPIGNGGIGIASVSGSSLDENLLNETSKGFKGTKEEFALYLFEIEKIKKLVENSSMLQLSQEVQAITNKTSVLPDNIKIALLKVLPDLVSILPKSEIDTLTYDIGNALIDCNKELNSSLAKNESNLKKLFKLSDLRSSLIECYYKLKYRNPKTTEEKID